VEFREDADKILRVVSTSGDAAGIINTINEAGYQCEEFTD